MKRDMDLIRQVLLSLEEGNFDWKIDGYSQEQVEYHVKLLEDVGFVTPYSYYPADGGSALLNLRMTWQGHEFLEAAKNISFWSKAKHVVITKTGSLSFDLLKEVLVQLAKDAVFNGSTP